MAIWFVPALKAILPHVGTIIGAARPVFSSRKAEASTDTLELMQKQIEELQAAASQNSSSIKELAAQLKETISAIERGALSAENQLKRATAVSFFSLGIGALALVAAVALLISR